MVWAWNEKGVERRRGVWRLWITPGTGKEGRERQAEKGEEGRAEKEGQGMMIRAGKAGRKRHEARTIKGDAEREW